ncbi:Amidase domain-containing protein/TPR_2 domain-containing protein/TPR_11 domain-containing protein [Cephalotus follicularis]|uniref:Amidase domain-containing protein/TPR_2 domain-containing protein/TPR_11 domain-containing protein n=1 Tax=Cephalotus follicularis TaxID=3775 RepID=A0A1Q3AT02_CEPFO|nr:Amidase domain-containing protein/TPR_2 domain-containing protein/TPR_11 domain-containing protein [Cephalotus follicularis]
MGSPPAANVWVLIGLGLAGILLMTKRFKKAIRKQDFGAFVDKLQLLPPPQPAPPKAPHPLTALTFAVSDLFDIESYVTGFGHPDWARTHEPASQTSPVVSALVEAGATCVGKTVVDEFAYSNIGENKHYGTPTNPAAPSRLPGGSSSGAAVAVAANLVDFSLGVDTSGGIRIPAGFCGVIGFRPSHGAVPHTGIVPISTSLDTVGWFSRDPNVLRRVGHLLLKLPFAAQRSPRQIIIADDCFQVLKIPVDRVSQVVIKSAEKIYGRQVLKQENLADYFDYKVPSLKEFVGRKANGELKVSSLTLLGNIMQFLQRHEFRNSHVEWINMAKPMLDPAFSSQVHEMLETTETEIETCKTIRNEMRSAVNSLLKDDGIVVIPTTAYPPPKLGGRETQSEDYQNRMRSLLSIASISGCCQATIPIGYYDKCPVSVSFIARHGGDRFLLDIVQTMYMSLQEHVDIVDKSKLSNNALSQEQSAEIAKEKGNQAYKDKQWQKAIAFYTEAIKLNGKNATYYSNRAAAYLELGSFLQAEADCTKAISLDKKLVKAYFRRGTAREMLGYYKEAIEDFQYTLVLEPTNKRASLSAGRLRKVFQ